MFATAHVESPNAKNAVAEAVEQLFAQVSDADLVIVLASGYAREDLRGPLEAVSKRWNGNAAVVGGTTAGNICGGKEFEEQRGVVIWGAKFDGGLVDARHVEFLPQQGQALFEGAEEWFASPGVERRLMLALAEPFSFPADLFAERLLADMPGVPMVGGMLSAAHSPDENLVLVGDTCFDTGCAAVMLSGNIPHSIVVSQGCRPIGEPMIVTAAERNEIQMLGGLPALEQLMKTFASLPAGDQQLVNRGLLLGIAMNEYVDQFGYGDFLIRHVMGVIESNKSIAVGDFVRVGKTVQFHVRDHESASADLKQNLKLAADRLGCQPAGGLLFTCNGRGQNLFPEPDHDAGQFAGSNPDLPLAGFFAAGEIGPVGEKTFVHGHTATGVLFG